MAVCGDKDMAQLGTIWHDNLQIPSQCPNDPRHFFAVRNFESSKLKISFKKQALPSELNFELQERTLEYLKIRFLCTFSNASTTRAASCGLMLRGPPPYAALEIVPGSVARSGFPLAPMLAPS